MSIDQIKALSDAELIRVAAVEVMEWKNISGAWMVGEDWSGFYTDIMRSNGWNPITNWNHTWMIVEAMRAKVWWFSMSDCNNKDAGVSVTFLNGKLTSTLTAKLGDEQSAILRAALMTAMSRKGGGE